MMDEIILITKKDCKKCEWIKDKIQAEELDVKVIDADSTDGMAHLSYHELYNPSDPPHMPILIVDDSNIIKGETINMLRILRENSKQKVFN